MDGKVCKRCDEFLDFSNFYKNKANKDGFHSYCKECTKKKSVKHRDENYDKYLEGQRRRNHEPIMKEAKKKYNESDKKKEYQLDWQRNNKDKIEQYNENRRQNKTHEITAEEWIDCKNHFDNSCAYCGKTHEEHLLQFNQDLHKEHVNHNGANDISNCVPACKSCNSSKGTADFSVWYNESNTNYTEDRFNAIKNWIKL